MPIDEDEWKDATVDSGAMKDIQSVLDDAYPQGLTKDEIMREWDRTTYSSTNTIVDSVLAVLVGIDEIESAVPDDRHDANTYYRLKK